MEPIYRMYKVIAEKDELKAQTFIAVVTQYISEHYKGLQITPYDVQNVIRAVLLHEEDGKYYAMYVFNEIQVKTAEWLTILAADLPITLDDLGSMADQIAAALEDEVCVQLSSETVVEWMEQIAGNINGELLERIQMNRTIYLRELDAFLAGHLSERN